MPPLTQASSFYILAIRDDARLDKFASLMSKLSECANRHEVHIDTDDIEAMLDVIRMFAVDEFKFDFTVQSRDYYGNPRPYDISDWMEYITEDDKMIGDHGSMFFVEQNHRLLNELKSILRHDGLFEEERDEIEQAISFVDSRYAYKLAMVVIFW